MAEKLLAPSSTGLSNPKFVLIRVSDGAYWSTAGTPAFEAYSAGNIANYGIAAAETGSTGQYSVTNPAEGTQVKSLLVSAAGASLAVSDVASNVVFEDFYGPDPATTLIRRLLGGANVMDADGLVPTSWNLQRAALRIRYGWANSVWVGDSTSAAYSTPRILYGILRTWDVRFVGIHVPQTAQVSDEGYSGFFTGSQGITETAGILPGAGQNGATNDTALLMTAGVFGSNVGNFTPILQTFLTNLDLYNSAGTPPKQFSDGDWTVKQRIKYALLYTKSTTNLTTLTFHNRRGSETVNSTAYDLSGAGSGTTAIAFDFPTPTSTAATTTWSYAQTGSGENETGKQLAHCGHLLYVEGAHTGYSHAAIAVAGWSTTDHLSPTNSGDDAPFYAATGKYTQAQLLRTLGLLRNPNVFFIMIGINIGADEDGTTIAPYKANVRKILNRYQAAADAAGITDPLFILVAPWQTSTDGTDGATTRTYRDSQAQAMYEVAQEYPADTGFINLHQKIKARYGAYSIWQGTLLADFTHQSTTGANAFMALLWEEITAAAATAAVAGQAMTQARKLFVDPTPAPSAVGDDSFADRTWNKNSSKTFSEGSDSQEAIADAALTAAGVRSAIGMASANLDTQLDAIESGGTLTITPLVASVANPFYATRDLPVLPAASANVIRWTITDGTGAAVDLSGATVRLVAYTVTAAGDDEDETHDDTISTVAFQYATGGDGITVGGADDNQVTLTHSITKTATAGDYRYMLWNITGNQLLAKGRMPIEPSVKGS